MPMLSADLQIYTFSEWFEQFHPNSHSGMHRLLWLKDGRGMYYLYAGLTEKIPQHSSAGWVLVFSEYYFGLFYESNPACQDVGLFDRLGKGRSISISLEIAEELELLAMTLKERIAKGMASSYLHHYLDLILLTAADAYKDKLKTLPLPHEAKMMSRLFQLMMKNYKTQSKSQFYAVQMKVSTKSLNALCVKMTGRNVVKEVTSMRLAEAKRRLALTSNPIKVIALDLGFHSLSHFSTFFSEELGISPREFRNKFKT